MDLVKRIFEYIGSKGPVITNTLTLRSKTLIDKDKYEIIDNEIGNYNNSFQPGSFGGTSQVDVSLSETRIYLDISCNNYNIV